MPQYSSEKKGNSASSFSKPDTWKKAWLASPGPVKYPDYSILFLKGMCMRTADIVPGISGGTVAFIIVIYNFIFKHNFIYRVIN